MALMTIQTLLAHNPVALRRLLRRSRGRIRIAPGRPSRANELWYKAELLKLVRHIALVTKSEVLPLLKSESIFLGDALAPATVSHRLNLLSRRFGNIDTTAKRLSRQAVQRNLFATDKQLIEHIQKTIGIDIRPILQSEDIAAELRIAEQANIALIKSIPAQYFDKVRKKLDQNYEQGGRWEELADAMDDAEEVTESRVKLIARDQTSKMNGAFNRVRQVSIGIKKYKWRTAGDERVRPTHHANDGQTFSWGAPPSETGNPGEDVNCRCVAEPDFELDEDDE